MSQEAILAFPIDNALRDDFVASTGDVAAAQKVLRGLVEDYVSRHPAPALSADERIDRMLAVRYAHASVALEGFTLSEAQLARDEAFARGDLTLEEFVQPAQAYRDALER